MMSLRWQSLALALIIASARSDNDTLSDTCGEGLWGGLLEEWATSAPEHSGRHGRVMSLPPTKGYYVSDRIDLMPPPPPHHGHPHHGPPHPGPPHHGHPHHGPPPYGHHPNGLPPNGQPPNGPSPNGPPPNGAPYQGSHSSPPPQEGGYSQYDEWQASPPPPPAGGKIVNKPPNPYKDKFRPSYPPPNPNQPIPLSPSQQWESNSVDRLDAPPPKPQKQVSETDLYLLSAIEKLVYRVDLMEKRLRKMEETMHYLVVGKETKPEPCAQNFTRVGGGCYLVSADAADWKAASLRCRKLRTHLLELDSDHEKRTVLSALLADKQLKGTDFWTGGLNPGLLWIWAHSARPVLANGTAGAAANSTQPGGGAGGGGGGGVAGDGRCLALVHDPALATYVYRGQDCALRHRYVCELPEEKVKEKLSNEIERVARELRATDGVLRRAKIMWTDQ